MKLKHQRLLFLLVAGVMAASGVTLLLGHFSSNLIYFYLPHELLEKHPGTETLRVGGLVKDGSVGKDGLKTHFIISDEKGDIIVEYEGVLPNLFREGQGVVVEGTLKNGLLTATQVLAKHDENYMPPEIAAKLKAEGYWKNKKQ